MPYYVSAICGRWHAVVVGTPGETEARRRGHVLVPDAEVETIYAMPTEERRRWARTRVLSGASP